MGEIGPDYDERPERMALARDVLRRCGPGEDVHPMVARRLLAEGLTPVLDVGCGEGELARHLPGGAWTGVDPSPTMLSLAPSPTVPGEPTALPFPDAEVELERWDEPLVVLESRRDVADYLVGKGTDPERARGAARTRQLPLRVTKRGALLYARRL